MYLIINNKRYTVSRRIHTSDTVKFLSVTENPGTISGTIQMYRDDGFLMSEDNAGDYQRQIYAGTLLTLTNKPEPVPVETGPVGPSITERVEDLEEALNMILTGVTEDETGTEKENPGV